MSRSASLPGFTVAPEPESILALCNSPAALRFALGPLALRLVYTVTTLDVPAELYGDLRLVAFCGRCIWLGCLDYLDLYDFLRICVVVAWWWWPSLRGFLLLRPLPKAFEPQLLAPFCTCLDLELYVLKT